MHKSVFRLLSLLLLLIIVCIYQKSETLYALSHPVEIQTDPINPKVQELEETKIASIQTATTIVKEVSQEGNKTFILLKEIKSSVIDFLSATKDKYITPSQSQEIISKTITQLEKKKEHTALISIKENEKEEIAAYIFSVFQERDKVLQYRDEVIKSLDKMIQKALYNRRIAIENMNNIFIDIENTQTRLIKERDKSSQLNPSQEKGQ